MIDLLNRRPRTRTARRNLTAPVALPDGAHILVVKTAGIGDLLLSVPALRALRAAYPSARIDVLVTPPAAGLLARAPFVDRVLVVDKAPFDRPLAVLRAPWRLSPLLLLWRRLRAGRYDAVLLMHHLTLPFGRLKYRLLLAAAGPAVCVGLDNGHGSFLDVRVPDGGFGARHEAEYCMDVVAAVGAPVPERLLGPSLVDLGWAPCRRDPSHPAAQAREPLVAMHLGSGSYSHARRWPPDRYVALARRLREEWNASVALLAGPDDGDLAARCQEAMGRPPWVSLIPVGGLQGLAQFLAGCDLFIGNDSLPMHLAVAAGIPVVAIFGPSNHRAWRPLPATDGGFVAVVRRDLACSPCFYRGHALGTPQGCAARACLTDLGVEPVLAAARKALSSGRLAMPARP
jgi:ADP-heptose:LPS heptosyltransferase